MLTSLVSSCIEKSYEQKINQEFILERNFYQKSVLGGEERYKAEATQKLVTKQTKANENGK